jgi:hypothetical protein
MLQVQADARPCSETPAHRIDEDVGRLEVRRCFWVTLLPTFETCESVVFLLRAPDLNQWIPRSPTPG